MRILHVIRRLVFTDGGPPVVVTRLAAAQAHLGHEVDVACYAHPWGVPTKADQLKRIPHWEGVRLHVMPRAGRIERMRGAIALRELAPLVAAADVVHIHNVWEMVLLRAATLAREAGKPYLIIPNGMLDPWSMAQKRLKKKIVLAMGYRRMLNSCATLHLLNADEKSLIAPLELKAPMAIIPNGVMLEEIDPLPPAGTFRSARAELKGKPYLLFLSRLQYKKGLDYLAKAFALVSKRHPELHLVVAGPEEGEKDNFDRLIAADGLSERVHVIGPIYGGEKIAAMVDCECFVLPSRQEGFSIAILEAMAAGAPVVISEACHFPEVAEAKAGEVVKLDAEAFAEAIDRVISSPSRSKLGENGRALIESRFTWDRVAQQAVGIYQEVIDLAKAKR